MHLQALEIAPSSPKLACHEIGALQELAHFRIVVVLHRRVLFADAFGFAQRIVGTSHERHQFSLEQREIGG
jgi:hypothetical protein